MKNLCGIQKYPFFAAMIELKTLREEKKMTQMQAATKAKVTIPTWHIFENGGKAKGALSRIAKAFKLDVTIHPNGSVTFQRAEQ